MARDYRTLKLEILAETKQFVDDMKKSETQVEGFGGKLEKFGKVAAAAFAAAAAAAAAYAGKLISEGVKAAIEDEAAQVRLATALQNVTGATEKQIAKVEQQITSMSLAFGVADDQLRPAFQRLATATGSLSEAQDGLRLALDISAATGKSVEAVSNALGKAYEGNTGALGRLGIGLSSAEIKSLGLERTMKQLASTFGGAATANANTLEGQINRLKIRFDETKESIGAGLLPIIKGFIDYVVNRFIPMIIDAKDRALKPIEKAFNDNKEAMQTLWKFGKDYVVPFFEFTLVKAIENAGKAIGTIINIVGTVVNAITTMIRVAIQGINELISAINNIPGVNIPLLQVPSFATSSGGVGMQLITPGAALSGIPNSVTNFNNAINAGSSGGGFDYGSIPNAPYFPMGSIGRGEYSNSADQYGNSGIVINVNSPSVIDETGFTRAVIDAMNSVEFRQGGGASALLSL